ncbi:protein-lysine methyltransferase METTL21D-like [Amphibalanus amphitrite]|uniref:protein-lysine methyltransferase METTL21D-like n=1 Tax=Amphibalanus amphitrite TaxID=1232801 RepID=UPI001C929D44|nr:protein-lysine methyltransferase METTL21D-like [Amphibalanus amphitrite]
MAASLVEETFVRVVEIESSKSELKIHQSYIGDVGCVVWDAALVLSKYIDFVHSVECVKTDDCDGGLVAYASQLIKNIHSARAIELGAGTGAVGLLAASLGCQTTLTDLASLMPLLTKNIEENNLQEKASAAVLDWDDHADASLPQPDLLLVADCVYYVEALLPLLDTISALAGPKTAVLISYEDRESEVKQVLQKKFSEVLRKQFDVEEVPTQKMHPDYMADDIHILVARKKQ